MSYIIICLSYFCAVIPRKILFPLIEMAHSLTHSHAYLTEIYTSYNSLDDVLRNFQSIF